MNEKVYRIKVPTGFAKVRYEMRNGKYVAIGKPTYNYYNVTESYLNEHPQLRQYIVRELS